MNLKSTAWNILKGKIEREIENLSKARLEKSETLFWSRPIIYPKKCYSILLNFDVWSLVQAASTVTKKNW